MKPGRLHAHEHRLLARGLEQALGLRERGVRAVAAAVHLDERDDVRGVEVVDADEVVRPGQPFGERVHGEAAGVAADDQLRARGLQAREEILLGVQELRDGLDDVGAAFDGPGHVRGHQAFDAVRDLLGGLGDEAELDELQDVLPDLAERPGDLPVVVVDEPHGEPVLREGLRDTLAHRPRAHDEYLFRMRHLPPWRARGSHRTRVRIRSIINVSQGRGEVNSLRRPIPSRGAGRRTRRTAWRTPPSTASSGAPDRPAPPRRGIWQRRRTLTTYPSSYTN